MKGSGPRPTYLHFSLVISPERVPANKEISPQTLLNYACIIPPKSGRIDYAVRHSYKAVAMQKRPASLEDSGWLKVVPSAGPKDVQNASSTTQYKARMAVSG